ncbi:unnamed protein product [Rhizophagus irregularis]|nr:unnamed protein product [Rhizophagus irregularis]
MIQKLGKKMIHAMHKITKWALWTQQHSPLLLQVTTTNPLESYHSACHKIIALDEKKHSDSEYVSFEFCTKNISAIGVDHVILHEIYKFPFPVQQMLVNEFNAVQGRIKKGKPTPGLISLNCN